MNGGQIAVSSGTWQTRDIYLSQDTTQDIKMQTATQNIKLAQLLTNNLKTLIKWLQRRLN